MGMLRFARFYEWLLGHGNTRKYTEAHEKTRAKNFLPRKYTELFPEGIYFSVCFRVLPWQLFLSWAVLNDTYPR